MVVPDKTTIIYLRSDNFLFMREMAFGEYLWELYMMSFLLLALQQPIISRPLGFVVDL